MNIRIPQLNVATVVVDGDQTVIFATSSGDVRRAPMSVVRSYILENFIESLDAVSFVPAAEDYIPILDVTSNTSVRVTLAQLAQFITPATKPTTQRSSPAADGFNVFVDNSVPGTDVHLILTPTTSWPTGQVTLPPLADCVDKQEFTMNTTQQVASFAVDGNGALVTGEPLVLAADDFFTLRFDASTSTWYRIG